MQSQKPNTRKNNNVLKSAKPFFTSIALLLFLLAAGMAKAWGQTASVADGTTTNAYVPVYGYYADYYQRSQTIYTESLLTAAGLNAGSQITKLTYYSESGSSSWGNNTFQVIVGTTTNTSFASNAYITLNNPITVYEGTLSVASSVMEIALQTPYTYSGGHLVIEFRETVKGSYSRLNFYGIASTNGSISGYSSTSVEAISPSRQGFIPKTTFTYHKSYSVYPAMDLAGGRLEFSKDGSTYTSSLTELEGGETIHVRAFPDEGYTLEAMNTSPDLTLSGTGNDRTFTMPEANVTVSASFSCTPHAVTIATTGSGTLTASPTEACVNEEIELSATYPIGYEMTLDATDANGQAVTINGTGHFRTLVMPNADVTVNATFEQATYNIICESPTGGSLSADHTSAHYGDLITVTAVPDEEYHLVSLKYHDGGDHYFAIFNPPFTFTMPAANTTLTAVFAKDSELNMHNGVQDVGNTPVVFRDSDSDPDGAWYKHYEDYTIHFLPQAPGLGVKIAFDSLFVNNDTLYFYDGDISDNNLIGKLTCNEYHAFEHRTGELASVFGIDDDCKVTVMSHNFMTVRFISDYHWHDRGWHAVVTQETFRPQAPAVAKDKCDERLFHLLPTSKGLYSTTLLYSFATDGNVPDDPATAVEYMAGRDPITDPVIINVGSGGFPITFKVKTVVKDSETGEEVSSDVETIVFGTEAEIGKPNAPVFELNSGTSTLTVKAVRPAINDTYHVYYTLDGSTPDNTSTELALTRHDDIPNSGWTTYTGTITLTEFCTVKAVTTGTTCPDIHSEVSAYTHSGELYLLAPEISFAAIGTGATATTTITPHTEGCTILY